MTALTAPPIDPASAAQLSDGDLEAELTLASLTTAREATFEILLAERRKRLRARSGKSEANAASVWRGLVEGFDSPGGSRD